MNRRRALLPITAVVLLAHAALLFPGRWWNRHWAVARQPQLAGPASLPLVQVVPLTNPHASVRPRNRPQAPARQADTTPPIDPPGTQTISAASAHPPSAASPAEPLQPTAIEPATDHASPASLNLLSELTNAPELHLVYQAERGTLTGTATLDFQPAGVGGYTLHWRVVLTGRPEIDWFSQGELGRSGLRPLRMVERRKERDRSAVNFQRDKGLISFSGPRGTQALPDGVQDRASWLAQLPLLVRATGLAMTEGLHLVVPVVTVRGDLSAWNFEVRQVDSLPDGQGGWLDCWRLIREPERPYDSRQEVWLSRKHGLVPVQIRITPVPGDESQALTLSLRSGLPAPSPDPTADPPDPADPADPASGAAHRRRPM